MKGNCNNFRVVFSSVSPTPSSAMAECPENSPDYVLSLSFLLLSFLFFQRRTIKGWGCGRKGGKRKETGPQAAGRGQDSRETPEVTWQEVCPHFRCVLAPVRPSDLNVTVASRLCMLVARSVVAQVTQNRGARTQITTQEAQLEKPL